MIEVKNLVKNYGKHRVLDDLSVQIKKGCITSFIGPNGAGKSTLLSIISRLIPKTSGEVFIDNKELERWDDKELAKKISILKQSNHINIRLTVRELISFGRFPYNQGRLTKQDEAFIDGAIDYMKLNGMEDKYLEELSGGQRQRAYIGMILAQDTEYILLDEPLNNLDMKRSVEIMKILRQLVNQLGKTVIIVIHDINFASCYSDYIVALKDGKIVKADSTDNIIDENVLKQIYDLDFKIQNIGNEKICAYF